LDSQNLWQLKEFNHYTLWQLKKFSAATRYYDQFFIIAKPCGDKKIWSPNLVAIKNKFNPLWRLKKFGHPPLGD
jgi:hypothetical protein